MKIGWNLENVIVVQAPCWLTWQVVVDILHWPKMGRLGRYQDEQDSYFSYSLQPLGLPIRVKARITEARDMQILAWQGRFWGVSSQVKMRFKVEGSEQTRITFQENLQGLGLLLISALFSMEKLVQLNQDWLLALAQKAEEQYQNMGQERGVLQN